nr:deoxynucleoside triphosphate triphosphohydrolase SAMHD1-like [Cherax quadricarinatus]
MAESLQNDNPYQISDKDVLCLKIAGLCHDLGHGPFSHTWERFMKKANPDANWKHEEMSTKIFDDILTDADIMEKFTARDLEEKDLNFIKNVIDPPEENKMDEKMDDERKGKHFLFEVTFEYERLIDSCKILKCDKKCDEKCDGKWHICYRDKDVHTLLEMFHTRALLHRKAYQHHTEKIINEM